jgi:hypothetical protein
MANSISPDDVDVFLDNAAWAICCSSTFHLWPTGTELENTGKNWQSMIIGAKTKGALTTTIRLVIEYSLLKMVYFARFHQ